MHKKDNAQGPLGARRKILLIDFGVPFGGAEVYLGNLVQLLRDRVEFYAVCVNPDLARLLRGMGVRVQSATAALRWGKFAHTLIGVASLCYHRVRYGAKDAWIQGVPEVALMPFARALGYRTLATQHFVLEPSVSRRLYPAFAWAATKVICVSNAVAANFKALVPAGKLIVIQNWLAAIPNHTARSGRREYDGLRILYVGRLEEFKGVSLLIDAAKMLKGRNGSKNIQLIIVGKGEYQRELEQRAEGLDIIFPGFTDDPARFYQGADLFVYPSRGPEGMPMAPLEAMSYALPCILSDLPSHREIAGGSAAMFRCDDAEDLALQIERFMTSPELLEQYGKAGRRLAEANYSAKAARERYIAELLL